MVVKMGIMMMMMNERIAIKMKERAIKNYSMHHHGTVSASVVDGDDDDDIHYAQYAAA